MVRTARPPRRPTEAKVIAGAGGAGAGAVVAGFILWALDTWAFRDGPVPGTVVQFVTLAATVGAALVAGWWAPHTLRRDIAPEVDGAMVELTAPVERTAPRR